MKQIHVVTENMLNFTVLRNPFFTIQPKLSVFQPVVLLQVNIKPFLIHMSENLLNLIVIWFLPKSVHNFLYFDKRSGGHLFMDCIRFCRDPVYRYSSS